MRGECRDNFADSTASPNFLDDLEGACRFNYRLRDALQDVDVLRKVTHEPVRRSGGAVSLGAAAPTDVDPSPT